MCQCPRCASKRVSVCRGCLVCGVCGLCEPLIDFPVSDVWARHIQEVFHGRRPKTALCVSR